jgi:glycolate oxidase FAD binding subunit
VTAEGDQFADAVYPPEYVAARFVALLGAEAVHSGAFAAAYAIDQRVPAVVVRPTSHIQAADALALASEMHLAVAPWGGSTQMSVGYPLTRLDVVLALSHFTQITPHLHLPEGHRVTVGAGCTIAAVNAALAPRGHFLALDGPLPERATVGGRLATSSLGLRRARYGNPRDLVDELVIARGNGAVMYTSGTTNRMMQHHTLGYDLNKIIVGSLGTLSVILEATLRVAPLPASDTTVIAAFAEPAALWDLLDDFAAAELQPAAAALCGVGVLAAAHGLTAELADLLAPAQNPLLLVRLAGALPEIRRQALTLRNLILKFGGSPPLLLPGAALSPAWDALDDFPATANIAATEAVIKVAALPSEIGTVVEAARALGGEHGLRLSWVADAVTGLVWLRVADGGADGRFAAALIDLQGALARRWRNVVVLGCASALRERLPLWGADPQGMELLRAIKGRFDPQGILNPGRLWGK